MHRGGEAVEGLGPVQRQGANAAGMADANERLFHGGLLSVPGQNIVDRPVGNSVGRAAALGKRSAPIADGRSPARVRSLATGKRAGAVRRRSGRAGSAPVEVGEQLVVDLARERLEDARMDVRLLADRDRVAELLGDLAEQLLRAPALAVGRARALDPERERVRRAVPGAEVLGGEVGAARLADVVVDVGRADAAHRAVLVDVLEQVLPRHRLAAAHDAGDARIVERDLVLLAALAAKAQLQAIARDRGVAIAQRRQPERAIGARVFLVADPHVGRVEQANDRREHGLALGLVPTGAARSAATRFLMRGSAAPNSSMRSNLSASRATRQSG